MKKVKRKKSLREASYNIGRGVIPKEELPILGTGEKPPSQRSPGAVAAAGAVRRVGLTGFAHYEELINAARARVAKELDISAGEAHRLLNDLMKKEKLKADAAAEKIIAAHKKETEKASPAGELFQKLVSAPEVEDRPSHPSFKALELKQYANPNELEKEFTKEGFPKLAFYASTELRSFLADQKEFNSLVDEVNNLVKQRDKLKAEGKRLPTGEYRFFDKEIKDKFQKLEAPILDKQEVLSAFIKSTIKPEIKKFEDLKNGDQTAISNFLDDLKKSTQKQGVGLRVNVMLELEDKGKISKEEVKTVVDALKSKKLLENKHYIKLANILF